MLVLFLLTWYVSRSEGGGRRSYNVELVSINLVGALGADLKEEEEARRQEEGGRRQ